MKHNGSETNTNLYLFKRLITTRRQRKLQRKKIYNTEIKQDSDRRDETIDQLRQRTKHKC